jgi:hypothetical protein
MSGFSGRCAILVVFGCSQLYYILHFIGLRIYCTGTNSAWYSAKHPICRDLGNSLFTVDFWLIAPLIVLGWFLLGERKGRMVTVFRIFLLLYLLLLRFLIASWVGDIEVEPRNFTP